MDGQVFLLAHKGPKRPNFALFPSSAWEHTFSKLGFASVGLDRAALGSDASAPRNALTLYPLDRKVCAC